MKSLMKLYILDGKTPIAEPDLIKWSEWFETADRIVAVDMFDGVKVSTVFLGIDHHFCDDGGPPVLFETMVFGGEEDGFMDRYSTWEEAEKQHRWLVEAMKSKLGKIKK